MQDDGRRGGLRRALTFSPVRTLFRPFAGMTRIRFEGFGPLPDHLSSRRAPLGTASVMARTIPPRKMTRRTNCLLRSPARPAISRPPHGTQVPDAPFV